MSYSGHCVCGGQQGLQGRKESPHVEIAEGAGARCSKVKTAVFVNHFAAEPTSDVWCSSWWFSPCSTAIVALFNLEA